MEVRTLVQPTANIVHVINLKRGDVYKRLVPAGYGAAAGIVLGVVTDVMHNGTEAALTALEMTPAGYGVEKLPTLKSFGTEDAPAIFAAQPEEVVDGIRTAREQSEQEIRTARRRLADAEQVDATLTQITDGLALTAPEVSAAIAAEATPTTPPADEIEF